MNENPEAFPGAGANNAGFVPADILLTPTAQNFLNQTKPWVRFMSVMVFICSGFMVIAGAGMILGGLSMGTLSSARGPFGSFGGSAGIMATGCFYILLAIIYIMPGIYLSQYASAIKLLQTNRSAQILEDAMKRQKSFWRFVGILTIIGLVLGLAIVVLVVVVGILNMNR